MDSLYSLLSGKTKGDRVNLLNEMATSLRESYQKEAMTFSFEADSLAEKLGDLSGQSRALENIGWIYYRQGQWQLSFEYSEKAYNLAVEAKDELQAARLMNNMGALYFEQQNYPMAIQQFKKGYELATKVNDLSTQIRSLNNVALNMVQTNQLDSAMAYASLSIKLNENAGSPYLTSFADRVIGDVYLAKGAYDSAQVIFNRSLQIAQIQGVKSFEAGVLHRLGNAYLKDGKLDQAEKILLYSIELCEENNFLDELSKSHRYLAKIYEENNDLQKAFFHQSKFLVLNDSLLNKSNRDRLGLLQEMFQRNLEESELELLKAQNENQSYRLQTSRRYTIFFAVTALLIGALGIRLFFLNKNVSKFNADLLEQQRKIEEQNLELANQSNQLKEMNDTKNKLFSILGHDLRGPISQVKSVIDLLLAGHLNQEEFNELLLVLNKDIDSVNFTLNNTLQWSMAQMDGFKVNLSVFDLREVVDNSLNLLQASFKEKELSIFNQMESRVEVYADRDLIEVVVRNILNNAVKFSNSEDAVTIFSETDGEWAHWYVLDQGIGMEEAQIQLLLSDSYSLTKSRPGTYKEKGSGLGLQLAKEFTRRCGGEISIDSHLGHGTKFCIRLPLANSIYHLQSVRNEEEFKG
ncbi:tetratricopeptide repeat-containing sensor histidine kinase [Algoriphagus boritolerans]|uniref:histidine kinase n=1 Tax=Algoriphagus boritolerans DSM 17298 = JCM 18970 TaxID=1120964 RepID=A0A1H5VJF5_9BACT|nr:tetratricopeptide repeat protein [Algoriphagus boritolerans]SEF87176.1 Signal transduction histidine kinase [Algoriphagus boritolerans DSM 17298 = JCM 18970]